MTPLLPSNSPHCLNKFAGAPLASMLPLASLCSARRREGSLTSRTTSLLSEVAVPARRTKKREERKKKKRNRRPSTPLPCVLYCPTAQCLESFDFVTALEPGYVISILRCQKLLSVQEADRSYKKGGTVCSSL